jgi:hypothetical protein
MHVTFCASKILSYTVRGVRWYPAYCFISYFIIIKGYIYTVLYLNCHLAEDVRYFYSNNVSYVGLYSLILQFMLCVSYCVGFPYISYTTDYFTTKFLTYINVYNHNSTHRPLHRIPRPFYEGRLQSSWTRGSAPLLCRGRRWLLWQVVVVRVNVVVAWSSSL